MKAYHLKTIENLSFEGFEPGRYILDSIYIPTKKVLVGFIECDENQVKIFNYSEKYCDNAQAIVEGNINVQGEIISKMEIDSILANKISDHPEENLVGITRKFDGSTDDLVSILSSRGL